MSIFSGLRGRFTRPTSQEAESEDMMRPSWKQRGYPRPGDKEDAEYPEPRERSRLSFKEKMKKPIRAPASIQRLQAKRDVIVAKREVRDYFKSQDEATQRGDELGQANRDFKAQKNIHQEMAMTGKRKKEIARMKIIERAYQRDLKRAEFVAEHPYIEKTGKAVGRAGKRMGKMAGQGVARIETAYGTTTGRSYMTGQRIAPIMKRKDPRMGKGGKLEKARSTQSQMRPTVAPTTYSLGERVAIESMQPSMFQSDLTAPGAIRQPLLVTQQEYQSPVDRLSGIDSGRLSQQEYFQSGERRQRQIDFIGVGGRPVGRRAVGVIQTTKPRQVNYFGKGLGMGNVMGKKVKMGGLSGAKRQDLGVFKTTKKSRRLF